MRSSTFIAWLFGLCLFVALVAFNDAGAVLRSAASVHGWFLVIVTFHGLPLEESIAAE